MKGKQEGERVFQDTLTEERAKAEQILEYSVLEGREQAEEVFAQEVAKGRWAHACSCSFSCSLLILLI